MKLTLYATLLCLLHLGCAKSTSTEQAWARHNKAVMKANKKAAAQAELTSHEEW